VVLIVWLADPLLGLQSVMVTLELEPAETDAIISMVICERTVAVLSFLERLSPATEVMTSSMEPASPIANTSAAIISSISENPPCRRRDLKLLEFLFMRFSFASWI
jgi:hypothetical protein